MRITAVDHLLLTVRDIAATCSFYEQVLGMEIVTFGEGRKELACGAQKINLHKLGNEFEPKASWPTAGSGDICLIADAPLDDVIAHLASKNVQAILGSVARTGALGRVRSVYFRDPDAN
jgi:catechol 2,3-dioxygenase-like lactoylglutathione lyase family enzyme